MPLGKFCNFMWHMLTRHASQEDRDKLRAQIWRPPPGFTPDKESPWSPENEQRGLMALKAQLGK